MQNTPPFNFWGLVGRGLLVGFLMVLLAIIFSGCHEPKPRPVEGTVHGRIKVDTQKQYPNGLPIIIDSSLIATRAAIKKQPVRIEGYPYGEDMQIRQFKLLEGLRKDIKYLMETQNNDTAYRHNIMRVADTMYYAIVRKRKGKIKINFSKSYTDKKLFVHDIPIDSITP